MDDFPMLRKSKEQKNLIKVKEEKKVSLLEKGTYLTE